MREDITQVEETGPKLSQLRMALIILIALVIAVMCQKSPDKPKVPQVICQVDCR